MSLALKKFLLISHKNTQKDIKIIIKLHRIVEILSRKKRRILIKNKQDLSNKRFLN
jgi:hypothetical protein